MTAVADLTSPVAQTLPTDADRPTAKAGRVMREPGVAAVIVTWNRRAAVDAVLRAVANQDYPLPRLAIVVVDNGSTDGTAAYLADRWRPEQLIENPTEAADVPAFAPAAPIPQKSGNAGGFQSLTVIRNRSNLGGCGGFNTGLAWVERSNLAASDGAVAEYVWLIDDDVDLPASALRRLVSTAESDGSIGIVGSRTVDFDNRANTTETTIYFDPVEGVMAPDPPPGHPMEDSHRDWIARVGGTRGRREYSGTRDVDIVSACSLLARWSAVQKVGFWDRRYFIYCDDADWCLRFRRAGYRVVCDLQAEVYHTYWLTKITPARNYYAQRNLLWMAHKAMPRERLRRVMPRRMASILQSSRKAVTHCRLFHAEIMRRTVHDMITDRGGRLDSDGPEQRLLMSGLDSIGALRAGAEILVLCSHPDSIAWADEWRARVTHALIDAGRSADMPRWTYMVRSSLPAEAGQCGPFQPERIVFAPTRRSKWSAQQRFLFRPPAATVVFDQDNDFPLLCSAWNVHVDRRSPACVQIERDSPARRGAFLVRWALTALRASLYGFTIRPRTASEKYG